MQSLGMIVTAGLGVLVIAEGAYIVRTRSQLATLTDKVEALSAAAVSDPAPYRRAGGGGEDRGFEAGDGPGGAPSAAVRPALRALPRFTTETPAAPAADSGDSLPLPPVISSQEAREQLRQFVLAQLERERQEARVRDEQRVLGRARERRVAAIQSLGLSGAEAEKFLAITDKADAARVDLRARIESGQLDRASVRQEISALRDESQRELSALLGDERMKKYDQIRREQGPGEGFGPPFGRGGGRGFGAAGATGPAGAGAGAVPPTP